MKLSSLWVLKINTEKKEDVKKDFLACGRRCCVFILIEITNLIKMLCLLESFLIIIFGFTLSISAMLIRIKELAQKIVLHEKENKR